MPVSGVNPEAAAAMQMQKQAAQAAASRVQGAMGGGPPMGQGPPGQMPMGPQGPPMPPANGLGNPGNPANPPPFASGMFDPRGIQGSMARGDNVYMGGLPNAPGAGRPRNPTPTQGDMSDPAMQNALQRRMQQYGTETAQHKTAAKRRGA